VIPNQIIEDWKPIVATHVVGNPLVMIPSLRRRRTAMKKNDCHIIGNQSVLIPKDCHVIGNVSLAGPRGDSMEDTPSRSNDFC
jgi:hypothetical protein